VTSPAPGFVQVAPDSTGKKIDTCEVSTASGTVERQGICVGDPADGSGLCAVRQDNAQSATDYSLAVHVRQVLDVALSVLQPLRSLARALALAPDPSTGRLRVLVDAITGSLTLATVTTVSTVTTCSTVTSVSQFAGFDAKQTLLYSNERASWAVNVRTRIT